MALAASLALAQSALNEANRSAVTVIVEEGKRCVNGLEAEDLRPFLNPSPAVKAVLLTDKAKLRGSEEMKQLNDQERKVVVDLLRTSRSCQAHLQSLLSLSRDLASKEAALRNDAASKDELTKVAQANAKVSATIEAATKFSPDLAHFLHVHGLDN